MNFEPLLPELCHQVRLFVREQIQPLERDFDETRFRQLLPRLEAVRGQVRRNGWWAPPLPRELGGMGLTLLEFAHLSEELGRSPLGHYCFNCQAPDIGTMELLLSHASEAQKERYLLPLARGEQRSCFCMTEPDYPGSNPVWMGTTARQEPDGWVLNGRKWFATGADGAQIALVMALTEPEHPEPHKRASLFLFPTATSGFVNLRNLPVMGPPGEDWPSHSEIELRDCKVAPDSLLGKPGEGFRLAQERLGPGRIHHTMRWIGIAERAFELMADRARERELKPGEKLAEQPVAQGWIADSRAEIDAARLLVLRAAWRIDRQGAAAARDDIALIKFHTAAMLQRVLDRAVQAHGGLGLLDETPLAFWYRNERAARIYDGADEVHKSSVGRRLLR